MTKKVERNYLEIFSIQDLRINHDIELDYTITLLELGTYITLTKTIY